MKRSAARSVPTNFPIKPRSSLVDCTTDARTHADESLDLRQRLRQSRRGRRKERTYGVFAVGDEVRVENDRVGLENDDNCATSKGEVPSLTSGG
jgi:hypothetical protein